MSTLAVLELRGRPVRKELEGWSSNPQHPQQPICNSSPPKTRGGGEPRVSWLDRLAVLVSTEFN